MSSETVAGLEPSGRPVTGPGTPGPPVDPGGRVTAGKIDKSTAASTTPMKLLERLGSATSGLTDEQVAERRAAYGPNTMTKEHTTAFRVLLCQFESPLVYFLMIAAALSFATGDSSDGGIIVAILVINAILGFSQEYRSERAVDKLAHLISDKATVKRSGNTTSVEATDLVPGDIVLLKEGDVVPADMKLLEAQDVQVDESQLAASRSPWPRWPRPAAPTADRPPSCSPGAW